VPRISAFYGILIYMYWNEGDHPIPHFHAHQASSRASVSVDGELLAGTLDPRHLALVRQWAAIHREELIANWEAARRSEPMLPIAPLP